jgi:hypothetical protein
MADEIPQEGEENDSRCVHGYHVSATAGSGRGDRANPDNAPEWYEHIKRVKQETDLPLALDSRIAFVANFMGHRLEYT